MANESSAIVQRLWNYCNVLRDDGVSYGQYVENLEGALEQFNSIYQELAEE